jgi:DNA-binding transcriptional MerR regulator
MDRKAAPAQNKRARETYTIGDLAAEFGLTLRCLRFYEDAGLIQPRRKGQARLYSKRDHARIALICRGKRLGFSIAEIKEFLDLYDVGACQKDQMRFLLERARSRKAALETQLGDVHQTLAELQKIEIEILAHLNETQEALT